MNNVNELNAVIEFTDGLKTALERWYNISDKTNLSQDEIIDIGIWYSMKLIEKREINIAEHLKTIIETKGDTNIDKLLLENIEYQIEQRSKKQLKSTDRLKFYTTLEK